MDYETLREINPSLIYASITGYGQTGPYSNRAGYDVMVEAEMGLMHITGSRGGDPVKVGVAVTDLTTGLYTSNAIMAALLARVRTGKGQHIDACLSDCQVATLSNIASSALISGQKDSGRWGTEHRMCRIHCHVRFSGTLTFFKHPLFRTGVTKPSTGIFSLAAVTTDFSVSCAIG